MKRSLVLLVLLAIALQVGISAATTRYTLTRLGTIGGYPISSSGSSYAYGINELGHVVGDATSPGNGATQAFVWKDGVMTGLGTLAGPASGSSRSYAYGINETDVVVGHSSTPGMTQAFSWQDGTMTGLGYLGSGSSGSLFSYAYGINDTGVIVGQSSSPNGNQAFLFDGSMGALDGLPGDTSARAIDVNGTIAGYGANQAYVLTSGGSPLWLGYLGTPISGGPVSYAYGINDTMDVVGYGTSPASRTEAFIWSPGQGLRGLGDLPGGAISSIAYGINDGGQVVGTSYSASGQEAFVWEEAEGLVSLNTLVDEAPGWTLRQARAINNSGQIAGFGTNPSGGWEAFLLAPVVPLPTPQIAYAPASFTFNAGIGGANPPDQTLQISNSQGGTLEWTVSTSAAWLGLSPTTGQQTGTTSLSVDTTGLVAGTYATNVTIEGNAANSPQSVPVTLTITTPPMIGVSPSSLSYTVAAGSAATQQLGITNAGDGNMFWTASGDQPWIRVMPTSGTVSSGVFTYQDVTADAAGKAAGTYTGNVVISAVSAANSPQHVPVSMTVTALAMLRRASAALLDGWVLEGSEGLNRGGTVNASAAALRVGDNAADRQYRGILSFDTSALPDNAVIASATLRLKKQSVVGTDPFRTHGALVADMIQGEFSGQRALEPSDFEAPATRQAAVTVPAELNAGWYSATLGAAAVAVVNKTGLTQLRLRFAEDDNGDGGADYLSLYSGGAAVGNRPTLEISYEVP